MSVKRLDTSKLSADDIQDMFSEVYESKIASLNDIDSFECTCKREAGKTEIKMEVMIVGMAGSPTIDAYKNHKVKGADNLTITREGKGSLDFEFVPKETVYLSGNDYVVVYKSM